MENQEELEEEVRHEFLRLPPLHYWVVPVVLLGLEVVQVDHLLEVGSAAVLPVIQRKHSPMSAFCQLDRYLGSQSMMLQILQLHIFLVTVAYDRMRDDFGSKQILNLLNCCH